MARYEYAGPNPVVDDATGLIVHPGDVWEITAEPDCPPWQPAGPAPEPEAAAETPGTGTEGGM